MSETISGVWGGFCHIRFRNVNFKAVAATLAGSLIGMRSAAYLTGLVVPSVYVKWYISILAFIMGILVIIKSYSKIRPLQHNDFSKLKCSVLGFIIGFNKGSTGGGYGPLSVSGYVVLLFSSLVRCSSRW